MKKQLVILTGVIVFVLSCTKQRSDIQFKEGNTQKEFDYNRFFPESANENPMTKRIFSYLKNENSKKEFLTAFVKVAGYPRWDKTIIQRANYSNSLRNENLTSNDSVWIIPLVKENKSSLNGVMIAHISGDSINCRYSLLNNYNLLKNEKKDFVLAMLKLDAKLFNHKSFKINDTTLFANAKTIVVRKREQAGNIVTRGSVQTESDDPCEIIEIWYDPDGASDPEHNSGNEYYTGDWEYAGDCPTGPSPAISFIAPYDGGSSYPLPMDGGGGGGGGGSSTPPYLTSFQDQLDYLLSQLDISPESSDFLSNSEPTVTETYRYLYNNTTDERIEIASAHVQNLFLNPDYLSFVEDYRSDRPGNMIWWEDDSWLDNPANFNLDIDNENNQQIKLTAQEKALIKIYPLEAFILYKNMAIADNMAQSTGLTGALNGKQDAFRHAFFNAINTRDVPPRLFGPGAATGSSIVRKFAIAHESEVPPQLQLEKEMDLFNNEVGISYCWNCWTTSNSSISNAILNKLNDGELRYLSPLTSDWQIIPGQTQLKPTNQ